MARTLDREWQVIYADLQSQRDTRALPARVGQPFVLQSDPIGVSEEEKKPKFERFCRFSARESRQRTMPIRARAVTSSGSRDRQYDDDHDVELVHVDSLMVPEGDHPPLHILEVF